jgi:hypothetical protein
VPPQDGLGRRIGLLQVDAPVSQFLKRNGRAGHRAADESAGPYDAKIAVQVFDFGLSWPRGPTICAIEQGITSVADEPLIISPPYLPK